MNHDEARARGRAIAAERKLWHSIRRLRGRTFARQVPLPGAGIADFFCAQAGVVVELTGALHDLKHEADRVRLEAARALGLVVLRVDVERVLSRTKAVVEDIARAVGRSAQVRPFAAVEVARPRVVVRRARAPGLDRSGVVCE